MSVAILDASTPPAANRSVNLPRRWSRRIAADLIGFVDMIAVVAGGMVPALIYAWGGDLVVNWAKQLQMCLFSAVIVYGALRNFGMYDTNRMHDFPVDPLRLIASLGIAFVCILGIGLPFAPREVHMWIWYGCWMAMSFMLLANGRNAAREILAYYTRAGLFDDRVAVYGSGQIARRVEDSLRNPKLGIQFAGLYDDRADAKRADDTAPQIAGRLDDLIARARSGTIDRIVIALPQSADQRTQQIARRLEQLPVSLHVVTHIASDLVDEGPAHKVSNIGSVGLLDVKPKPLADWNQVVKAAEDAILAPLLTLLALPLIGLIALAVKLDSRGPVFFRQRRIGQNQTVFEVIKFRTMHVMEDGTDVPQATKNDPRVTRVGRILRRLSLDELPQLFNVLGGHMSLIGPRPHALAHDERFAEIVARYPNRHQVKPGMTGLAQVYGLRGEVETPEVLEKRLEKDLEYVNNWTLWLDLKILLLTPFGCWSAKTAY